MVWATMPRKGEGPSRLVGLSHRPQPLVQGCPQDFVLHATHTLAARDPGEAHQVYSSTDGLPELALQARAYEESLGKGTLEHQWQELACTPPSASADSASSLGQHLPYQLWACTSTREARQGWPQ